MALCSSLAAAAQATLHLQTLQTQRRAGCLAAPTSRLQLPSAGRAAAGQQALRPAPPPARRRRSCRRRSLAPAAYLKQHDSATTVGVTEQVIAALNAHDPDKPCSLLTDKVRGLHGAVAAAAAPHARPGTAGGKGQR